MQQGVFITIEGMDGSGKTTQAKYLTRRLRELGFDVVLTREPGGCPNAEATRSLLFNTPDPLDPLSELMLFYVARREHIQQTILPALRAGQIVVCDRFNDSSVAYQGHGRGMLEQVQTLSQMVLDGLEPQYTLYFHATKGIRNTRLAMRDETNYLDAETEQFKERMEAGYHYLRSRHADRFHTISANGDVEQVQSFVDEWLGVHFLPSHSPL